MFITYKYYITSPLIIVLHYYHTYFGSCPATWWRTYYAYRGHHFPLPLQQKLYKSRRTGTVNAHRVIAAYLHMLTYIGTLFNYYCTKVQHVICKAQVSSLVLWYKPLWDCNIFTSGKFRDVACG
jgi:hypothetical protein